MLIAGALFSTSFGAVATAAFAAVGEPSFSRLFRKVRLVWKISFRTLFCSSPAPNARFFRFARAGPPPPPDEIATVRNGSGKNFLYLANQGAELFNK